MRIINLTIGAFGKLSNFTLTPDAGFNLIDGPNEYGKSTILAFIRAMFYGFSRRSSGRMREFDRRRYMPWQGGTFGGSIRFIHDKEEYLLERVFSATRAEDRTVLSIFATGRTVDLKDTEPGCFLFQIGEADFANTAYIGQLSCTIGGDGRETEGLSAQLTNLSGNGDETVSFAKVDAALAEASTRIQSSRSNSGTLSAAQEDLRRIRDRMGRGEELRAEAHRMYLHLEECRTREAGLTDAAKENRQRMEAVRAEEEKRQKQLVVWNETMTRRAELSELSRKIEQIEEKMREDRERFAGRIRAARQRIGMQEARVRESEALLASKEAETAQREREQMAIGSELADLRREIAFSRKFYLRLFGRRVPGAAYIALFVIAASVGFTGYLLSRETLLLLTLLFILPAAGLLIMNRRDDRRLRREERAQSYAYDARMTIFENATASLFAYRKLQDKEKETLSELTRGAGEMRKDRIREMIMKRDLLYETKRRAEDLHVASERDQNFLADDNGTENRDIEEQIERLRDESRAGKDVYASLLAEEEQRIKQTEDVRIDAARTQAQRESLLEEIPDETTLEEQEEELLRRVKSETQRREAIETARDYLNRAFSEMEKSFAPLVADRTAYYLSKMTGGSYDKVSVSRDFAVKIQPPQDFVYRPLAYFSGGTVDQLYFSLRLSVSDTILSDVGSIPLLLDDAFVQYDDKRALAAMRLLRELSEERQVFLFTCQERMRELYDKSGAD